jgi:hypothetical protein
LPKRVLTRETLTSLSAAIKDDSIDAEKRANELRSVLDLATVPEELAADVKSLLFGLVDSGAPKPLREAVLYLLPHFRGDWQAAVAMMVPTDDAELRLTALSQLDLSLGEYAAAVMMHYLEVCAVKKEHLELDHLSDIVQKLKCFSDSDVYRKCVESEEGKRTLQFHFDKHPAAKAGSPAV